MQAPTSARSSSSHFRAAEPVDRAAAELELLVLHATHDKRGIDPRLRDLPELTKPPFASFATYSLLESVRLPLRSGEKRRTACRTGACSVRSSRCRADGVVRLSASISEPGGNAFSAAARGARQGPAALHRRRAELQSGILVLVLTLAR
jgi:hypothetical protein